MEILRKRHEFLKVAASRRKSAEPGLVLQVGRKTRNQTTVESRVGFTASRKVGNAVERSRAKRRLRSLAQNIMALEAEPGRDYVLVARRAILSRPYPLLEQDLRRALKTTAVERQA
jgi:ribonuclease P protein component